MKKLGTFGVFCTVVLGLGGVAQSQDKPAAPAGMPPMPKPGPEHAIFRNGAGTWDAKVESFVAPGQPAQVSTGTEVVRLGCSGLCAIADFTSTFMNTPFEGHGTETYDSNKKKYVGSWTDSMSAGLYVTESTYDAAAKTMNGWMEGPDMTGNTSKMKVVTVHPDADHRVFSMYSPGASGAETLAMRITYTRKK